MILSAHNIDVLKSNSHLQTCLRYMLLGGAVSLWMLLLGRFLTGVAGGMTAASIPVRYNGHIINTKKYKRV